MFKHLTLSARQTQINTCANSVDPDDTSNDHQDLHSLRSCFDFRLKLPFTSVDKSKSKNGILKDESVKPLNDHFSTLFT